MAPRAVWKGYLKIGELSCAVSLYTAVSTSERIAFHTLNRGTGHRVRREFVDSETGTAVPRDSQVKGYETTKGEYVVFEPEEIAAAVPESDHALAVDSFVPCHEIDTTYFDRPYFLCPGDKVSEHAYALIRDGLSSGKVAALARAVLFRRVRTVLIRAHDGGLIATLLNFDYEVRSAGDAFDEVPAIPIKDEMTSLAEHIIRTKMGKFDPKTVEDRYEAAVADMVRAKMEGRPLEAKAAPKSTKVVDLLEALRASAAATEPKPARGKAKAKTAPKPEAPAGRVTAKKAAPKAKKAA